MRHHKWSIDGFFNFNVTRELITSIPPIMVRSHETSKLNLKMYFFYACSENDIINDAIIFGLEWQNIPN